MTQASAVTAEVYQNEYLPRDSTVVDAVVTITSTQGAASGPGAGAAPTSAQVIMIDCSGSMADPSTKLTAAKRATAAAIDALRDGVPFAVVAGNHEAMMAFPDHPELVPATAKSRAAAKRAVTRLLAGGGTAMGQWLELADQLFATSTAEVKHGILLTDGRNEHETPEQLDAILRGCEGRFVCDSRGVGANWSGSELRKIASALLGTADGLPDPAGLVADFRSMTEAAMGKSYARAQAAPVDPGRGDDPVRQAGLPAGRGPDRAPDRGQPAHRRVPAGRVGGGESRLPRQRPGGRG